MLEKKVSQFIARHRLIKKGARILVGVSGGPDSLALLHYLWSKKEVLQLTLVVAHVDHMFRGQESYEDLLFVKHYCHHLNIPIETTRIDVPQNIKETGKSTQVAARECRYAFFEKVMKNHQLDVLAIGHHGDDQVETIIMRLTRGSAGKARAGIPVRRKFGNGEVIRPFLAVDKEEIEKYCKRQGLVPRRDPSNIKATYTRNRLRLEVLTALKRENPQVHEHFQRFSEELREDEIFLQELTVRKMATVMEKESAEKITLHIPLFLKMPNSLQRRGIQLILSYLYYELPSSLSATHIEEVFSMINQEQPSGILHFPRGLFVVRSYNKCHFQFSVVDKQDYYFELDCPQTVELPNGDKIEMKFTDTIPVSYSNQTMFIHQDDVKLPLVIRTRKDGDRMTPLGMKGTKKIKNIFIEEKIPIMERNSWPIVTDRKGEIIWLPGLKKSKWAVSNEKSGRYISLTYTSKDLLGGLTLMKNDIKNILITEEEIQEKIRELASQLTEEYQNRFPLVIGVLKGAMPFMAELLKKVDTYLEMDFMDVSSYGNAAVSSGEVKIIKDLDTSVEGRDILIIEDIIDSGLTLSYLVELFRYRKAKSIKIVTLLDKPTGRKVDISADYVCFTVPDAFVVGYGLDYQERYRNLPYIGVLKPEVYNVNS